MENLLSFYILQGGSDPTIPFYILGVSGIVAAGVAVTFPETAGEKLPETAEEAEQFGKGQPLFTIPFLTRRKRLDK